MVSYSLLLECLQTDFKKEGRREPMEILQSDVKCSAMVLCRTVQNQAMPANVFV